MDKKEYLKQMFSLSEDIETERKKYYRLEEKVLGRNGKWQATSEQKKMLQCYKQKTDERIDSLLYVENEIETAINNLTDKKQRDVMTHRYILGQRWDVVASELNFDERWVYRLHENALDNIVLDNISPL